MARCRCDKTAPGYVAREDRKARKKAEDARLKSPEDLIEVAACVSDARVDAQVRLELTICIARSTAIGSFSIRDA